MVCGRIEKGRVHKREWSIFHRQWSDHIIPGKESNKMLCGSDLWTASWFYRQILPFQTRLWSQTEIAFRSEFVKANIWPATQRAPCLSCERNLHVTCLRFLNANRDAKSWCIPVTQNRTGMHSSQAQCLCAVKRTMCILCLLLQSYWLCGLITILLMNAGRNKWT